MLTLDHVTLQRQGFSLTAHMTIPQGARVAVIGPSGAGKSTLLDLIAGFAAPVQGSISIDGKDMTALPPGLRPVAHLFQDNNLFPHLKLSQNLTLAMHPRTGRAAPGDMEKIERALARVGLDGMADRRPGTLSGGQQSRAALARALVQNRKVLLLDEPFAALGPALRADMASLVKDVTAAMGVTTLMVTHDMTDAKRFADQAVLVADGTAFSPQSMKALMERPPDALRAYLGVDAK